MKQRFSSLDVKVIAHELAATLTSFRITNIYDLSSRIFLFKLHKPDHREQLVVDCGFRCHLTSYARTTAAAPSPFVVRLRKSLRSRRVTSVAQVGTDRIIEFQFSDGLYRLFLEFYAAGNIVLTDKDLKVIALFRNVSEGAEHEQLKLGAQYNLSLRQNFKGTPPLSIARLKEGLLSAVANQKETGSESKKSKKKGQNALRKDIASFVKEFPPVLIDHGLRLKNFDARIATQEVLGNQKLLADLLAALEQADSTLGEIVGSQPVKGYIIAEKAERETSSASTQNLTEEETSPTSLVYEDFHPFKPKQFESDPELSFLEFEGFNKTVDEYFSSIEGQKLESKLNDREQAANKRLEQARRDHAQRIGGLRQIQELNVRKAGAIEANIERVGEATASVNALLAQGMDWVDIARLIETEQSRNNPVAAMIKLPLKLYENTVTTLLAEPYADQDDDVEGSETESEASESDVEDELTKHGGKDGKQAVDDKRLAVDIDLSLSPWANAKQYYDQKKVAVAKEEKTHHASTKALKSVEQKISADLKKGLKQEKEILRPVRKQFWFEKFIYFISSEGYLVLAGKDAQQNEVLYRRYLRKGDVYIHADLRGAATVIVKNNPSTPEAPIPPSTLSQAGNLAVATSDAWDSKAVMSAWWVNSDQVSKTAPTGEYLTTGAFMIRGKKNFLPPAQLLLGFAVMFHINEESKAQHVKHRILEAEPSQLEHTDTPASDPTVDPETLPTEDSAYGSEDEFPDAKLETASDDSDEDFPDARLNSQLNNDDDRNQWEHVAASSTPRDEAAEDDVREEQSSSDNTEPIELRGGMLNSQASDDLEKPGLSNQTDSEKTRSSKDGHRHISAKERRLLKKGGSIQPGTKSTTPNTEIDSDVPDIGEPETQSIRIDSVKTQNTPLPRGKRGKQKKLAAKYADQDEEERALAMRLLGSKTGQEQAEAAAAAKRAKEEEAAAQKQRRREQHLRVQAEGKKAEEARRKALRIDEDIGFVDENIEDDEEAARLQLLGLDCFVGRPLPGDELLAAVPVCGPWSALGNYKYRAKLQPGAQKKGKAVKEILAAWDSAAKVSKNVDQTAQDGEKIWPRETELIKAWKDTEVIGVIPIGKMKVTMSGGQAGSGGRGGAAAGKGKGKATRGGKGSKKNR